MKEYKFQATIIQHGNMDTGYVEFPYSAEKEFGRKGNIKVKAYFDGYEYRGLLSNMGMGCHIIILNKTVRTAIGKGPGDVVDVLIIEDTEERVVEIPDDLQAAFDENPDVVEFFNSLSFTNRKEYAVWITSAKRQETRESRLLQTIEKLKAGKKNPSAK